MSQFTRKAQESLINWSLPFLTIRWMSKFSVKQKHLCSIFFYTHKKIFFYNLDYSEHAGCLTVHYWISHHTGIGTCLDPAQVLNTDLHNFHIGWTNRDVMCCLCLLLIPVVCTHLSFIRPYRVKRLNTSREKRIVYHSISVKGEAICFGWTNKHKLSAKSEHHWYFSTTAAGIL